MQRARPEHNKASHHRLRTPGRRVWGPLLAALVLCLVAQPIPGASAPAEDAAASAMRAPVVSLLEQAQRHTLAPLYGRKLVVLASLLLVPLLPLVVGTLPGHVWRAPGRRRALARFGKLQLEGG